jgi:hypothetical protein
MRRCVLLLAFAVASCAPREPLEPATENPDLQVELRDGPLRVTFTNKGDVPLRILKPLDGSEHCWIMPHYDLTLIDTRGKKLVRGGRCGNFGLPYSGTKWPEEYLITIQPGASHHQPLDADHYRRPSEDVILFDELGGATVKRLRDDRPVSGTFTAQFRYVFLPDTDDTPGGPYPSGLWRGKAVSAKITIKLPSDQR